MATPVGGGFFTDKELAVAAILEGLPELVAESSYRRILADLRWRWGARRRRTGFPDDAPPPPPSTVPSLCEEGKKEEAAQAGETSSPATPLSFPASGGEEPEAAPASPPRLPAAAKAHKNPSRHNEWLQKQKEMAASLSGGNVDLRRQIEEFRSRFETARAMNSFLLEQRSKLGLVLGQTLHRSFYVQPDLPVPVGPTPPQPPPLQPTDRRLAADDGRPSALDLNARPVEEGVPAAAAAWDWEQRSALRAAMSAQARQRRLAKQREKNAASVARSQKGASKAHKLPRLR